MNDYKRRIKKWGEETARRKKFNKLKHLTAMRGHSGRRMSELQEKHQKNLLSGKERKEARRLVAKLRAKQATAANRATPKPVIDKPQDRAK